MQFVKEEKSCKVQLPTKKEVFIQINVCWDLVQVADSRLVQEFTLMSIAVLNKKANQSLLIIVAHGVLGFWGFGVLVLGFRV